MGATGRRRDDRPPRRRPVHEPRATGRDAEQRRGRRRRSSAPPRTDGVPGHWAGGLARRGPAGRGGRGVPGEPGQRGRDAAVGAPRRRSVTPRRRSGGGHCPRLVVARADPRDAVQPLRGDPAAPRLPGVPGGGVVPPALGVDLRHRVRELGGAGAPHDHRSGGRGDCCSCCRCHRPGGPSALAWPTGGAARQGPEAAPRRPGGGLRVLGSAPPGRRGQRGRQRSGTAAGPRLPRGPDDRSEARPRRRRPRRHAPAGLGPGGGRLARPALSAFDLRVPVRRIARHRRCRGGGGLPAVAVGRHRGDRARGGVSARRRRPHGQDPRPLLQRGRAAQLPLALARLGAALGRDRGGPRASPRPTDGSSASRLGLPGRWPCHHRTGRRDQPGPAPSHPRDIIIRLRALSESASAGVPGRVGRLPDRPRPADHPGVRARHRPALEPRARGVRRPRGQAVRAAVWGAPDRRRGSPAGALDRARTRR